MLIRSDIPLMCRGLFPITVVESLVIKGLVNLNLGNENRDQLERKEHREFEHVTSRVITS